MRTIQFIRTADQAQVSLAESDDQICNAVDKKPTNTAFCDEYHMICHIGDMVYSNGFFSSDTFEVVFVTMKDMFKNADYLEKFKKVCKDFLVEKYKYNIVY